MKQIFASNLDLHLPSETGETSSLIKECTLNKNLMHTSRFLTIGWCSLYFDLEINSCEFNLSDLRQTMSNFHRFNQLGTVHSRPWPGLCSKGYIVAPFTKFLWSTAAFLMLEMPMGSLWSCFLIIEHACSGSPDPAPTLLSTSRKRFKHKF